MKKSIKSLLIGTAIVGSLAAGLAHALSSGSGEYCMRGRGMDSESHVNRMVERLDLTKEQRDKVRTIVDKARPQTRDLHDKLSENRKQLRALTQQGTVMEGDIRKLADSQGKLIANKIVQRSKLQAEVNAVLTPEQREKMQQRLEHRGRFSHSGKQGGRSEMSEGT
jgi:Spy/CpxP family protein refolding chaperone